jgi:TetR/AcrR family transcriptional regulator, transcriptional repressor for nem operon
MKVSKEKMAEHRETIITAAAKRFRELGFEGISVAELMKEAGLTHGGFYGHFSSKEELIALATERAMRDSTSRWERILTGAPDAPMEALAQHYLSMRHCKNPGVGCLFSSLGTDVARQPSSVRSAVTDGLQRFFKLLEDVIPKRSARTRRRKAILAYAGLVGGMVLARSTEDQELAEEILNAVAESLPYIATA